MKTNQKTILQRTMIAAAIAALSAGAFAADTQWPGAAPEGANTEASWDKVAENNSFTYTNAEKSGAFLQANAEHDTFSGKLWVTGSGNAAVQATGLWADGEGLTLQNAGSIYVTSAEGAKSWSQHAMGADHGAKAVNNGTIVAKKAYGMFVGSEQASTLVNGAAGTIYVEDEGVGMELGGAAGSEAFNYGKIYVGTPAEGSFAHGVLIKAAKNSASYEFTNAGLIHAAEKASALEIKNGDDGEVTSATVNLVQGSRIEGAINVSATGLTTFNVKNVTDTLELHVDEAAGNFTLNVNDGSNLTLADGMDSTIDAVVVENARLNASIWGDYTNAEEKPTADNTFKSVTINEGGIFNVTKLNSVWNDPATAADESSVDGAAKNQLLIKEADYQLNGGSLYAAGSNFNGHLKIGTASNAASLTITNGNYAFSTVMFGVSGEDSPANAQNKLTINGGSLSVADYDATWGATDVVGGQLTIGTLTLQNTPRGQFTVDEDGILTINEAIKADESAAGYIKVNGTLRADASLLFKNEEETYSATDAAKVFDGADTGVAELTGIRTFTKAQYDAMDSALNAFDLVLVDGKMSDADDYDLSHLTGYGALNNVIAVEAEQAAAASASADLTGDVGVAGLKVGAETKTVTIDTKGNELLIAGKGGNLISGADVETLSVTGDLQLGYDAASSGIVNAGTLTATDLDVVGSYKATNVEVTNKATISGSLTAASLAGGEYTVQDGGKLAFDVTNAAVTAEAGSTIIFGKAQPQTQPEARAVSLQPQIAKGVTHINVGAVGTTNVAMDEAAFAAAYADKGYDAAKMAGLYVDSSVVLGEKATLRTASSLGTDGIRLNTAFAVINANAFSTGGDPVFQAKDLGIYNSTIYLDGLRSEKTITFFDGKMSETDIGAGNGALKDSNVFLDGKLALNAEQTATELQITYQATGTEVDDYLPNLLREGGNAGLQNLYAAIGNVDGPFVSNGKLTNEGVQASNEVAAMPVTAGTYNVAYDAAEQVTGTVQRRNLEPSTGLGVWADVFYSTNEAKSIYGGQGYSADIYGGTIGFDGTFSCGAKLGLALSVGSGDADSEKSVGKYSNDADFYGVTVYTGKDIAGLYFSADASYLWLDNDISGQVAGASVKDSIDSNVFTVGVRADMTVYDQAFKVVPHVGMRYTNIDVDNYRGIESDSMNVFEMPIGVKVAGDFEPAAGWKLTPSFDFTVVPQVGDKNVSTLVGDIDVLDNLYNSTLGVNATYGNFAFGLSYRYGFGNDDRSNNAFQARASYQF